MVGLSLPPFEEAEIRGGQWWSGFCVFAPVRCIISAGMVGAFGGPLPRIEVLDASFFPIEVVTLGLNVSPDFFPLLRGYVS